MSAMGGTKSAAVAASHGKSTQVSWLTSVTKLSTSARPAGFCVDRSKVRRAEHSRGLSSRVLPVSTRSSMTSHVSSTRARSGRLSIIRRGGLVAHRVARYADRVDKAYVQLPRDDGAAGTRPAARDGDDAAPVGADVEQLPGERAAGRAGAAPMIRGNFCGISMMCRTFRNLPPAR